MHARGECGGGRGGCVWVVVVGVVVEEVMVAFNNGVVVEMVAGVGSGCDAHGGGCGGGRGGVG